jgi:hypothetical protein
MDKRWRVALWVLLAVALGQRLSHASVGLPYLFRWDEPLVVNSGLWALAHGWDPFTFRYGSFPVYLSAAASAVAFLAEMASGRVSSFAQFVDIGPPLSNVLGLTTNAPVAFWYSRVLFAVISVTGLGVTYSAARSAGASARGAFLAVLAIVVSPLHLRATLLAIVDGIGMTLVAGSLASSLWFLRRDEHSRRALIAAGVLSGLAIATKFALFWTPLIPVVAVLLGKREWRDRVWPDLGVLAISVAGAFVVTEPYAILEPGRFLAGVGSEVSHYLFLGHPGQDGSHGKFAQLAQVGRGLAESFGPGWLSYGVLLLSLAGAVSLVTRQWKIATLLTGWVLWQLVFLSQQVVFFERSLLPMLPALAVLAAVGLDSLVRLAQHQSRTTESRKDTVGLVVTSVICLAFLPILFTQFQEARGALNVRDTRSLATEWLVEHVKPGEQVAISNQLPFDMTELRRHRIAARFIDPLVFPCWFATDPYAYYVTSNERGPFQQAPVHVAFEGRVVTTDEPLFSPQVSILGRTPGQCDVVAAAKPAQDWKTMQPEFGGGGYDSSPRFRGSDYSLLGYDGWAKFPNVASGEGPLTLQIDARATNVAKVPSYALVKVKRADNSELVGWHFMPIDTTRSVKEITFRVPAGEYFVVVSQPYELDYGLSEPYLVELAALRVHHPPK